MTEKTITKLMKESHETAVSKGWWENGSRNFGELCMLFVSEISEAFEEHRNNHELQEIYYNGKKPEGVAVEFADLLIRVFDTCEERGIPIVDALEIKMEYNKTRPHRHGGKKA